jgi:hypothetical protein
VVPAGPDAMRRAIVAGLVATAVMVALLAATQLIDFGVYDLRLKALNTDTHASLFGVISLLAQLAAAAAIVWRGSRTDQRRWAWLALGLLIGGLVVIRGLVSYNAKTVAAPLACVLWLLCWLTWRDPIAARTVIWAALVLLVTSLLLHEVGLDADVLNYSDRSWGYQFTAVAKHGCELAGWMLVVTGIIAGFKGRSAPETTAAEAVCY